MRVFLIACLAVVVLAIGALYLLGSVQEPAGVAYSSSTATRTEPGWSWREPISTGTPAAQNTSMSMSMADTATADCGRAGTWTYLRTDFAGTVTADPICH